MWKPYHTVKMLLFLQASTYTFVSGYILSPSGEDQGTFSQSLIAPTDSCYRFKLVDSSIGYCSVSCLKHSGRTYLFGIDHSTGQCACCDYPLLHKVQSTTWVSYERCPIGFTEVRGKTTKFCFQLFWTPEFYSGASTLCRELTGKGLNQDNSTSELVRLDSMEKFQAFGYFLQNLKAPEDVWIQGVKGYDLVWRYEDGSLMSDVCPKEFTHGWDEFQMRFKTYEMKCCDRIVSRLSFACEAKL